MLLMLDIQLLNHTCLLLPEKEEMTAGWSLIGFRKNLLSNLPECPERSEQQQPKRGHTAYLWKTDNSCLYFLPFEHLACNHLDWNITNKKAVQMSEVCSHFLAFDCSNNDIFKMAGFVNSAFAWWHTGRGWKKFLFNWEHEMREQFVWLFQGSA